MEDLRYITDPSHSYLRVPIKYINNWKLDKKISEYSFFNNKYAWLEMDNDSMVFFDALDERGIREPTIYTQTLNDLAYFRLYPRFFAKETA